MSENYEVMETTVEEDNINDVDYSEEGGSRKAIGLTVGILTGAVALGVAAYKKCKTKKKDEKPRKKVRKRLKWVEIEDSAESEDIVESTAEEIIEEVEKEE